MACGGGARKHSGAQEPLLAICRTSLELPERSNEVRHRAHVQTFQTAACRLGVCAGGIYGVRRTAHGWRSSRSSGRLGPGLFTSRFGCWHCQDAVSRLESTPPQNMIPRRIHQRPGQFRSRESCPVHATAIQDLVGPSPVARALRALCRGMEGPPTPQEILPVMQWSPRTLGLNCKDTRHGSTASGRTTMPGRS